MTWKGDRQKVEADWSHESFFSWPGEASWSHEWSFLMTWRSLLIFLQVFSQWPEEAMGKRIEDSREMIEKRRIRRKKWKVKLKREKRLALTLILPRTRTSQGNKVKVTILGLPESGFGRKPFFYWSRKELHEERSLGLLVYQNESDRQVGRSRKAGRQAGRCFRTDHQNYQDEFFSQEAHNF